MGNEMIDPADRQYILTNPLFDNLSCELREKILQACFIRHSHRRQFIVLEGDTCEYVYIVLEGWVQTTLFSSDDEEVITRMDSAGKILGLSAAVSGGIHQASMAAATDVRVLMIPVKTLRAMMQVSCELTQNILTIVGAENNELAKELVRMKAGTAVQKVIEFLLELSPQQRGSAVFSLPYSKSLIARHLGIRPESFSRVLMRLRSHTVKVTGDRVQIGDISLLRSSLAKSDDALSQTSAKAN